MARVLLPYIIDRGASYGQDQTEYLQDSSASKRGKVVVEFSSPNLGQEFNGDHLRSTIIGTFIASVYENMGWEVSRVNFLGDWGNNIGLLAVGWAKFHSEDLFNEDPLRHLLDVYAKIQVLFRSERELVKDTANNGDIPNPSEPISEDREAFFRRMEDGDPEALALWNRLRESFVPTYIGLYARLGIKFDEYSGESRVSPVTTAEIETVLKEKGIEKEEDGAWIADFENNGYKGLASQKLRYQNGTTTYLLRDIATALERHWQHSFDKMIYVVTGKQDLHFRQVIAALELMGHAELASKLQHINFGMVHGLAPGTDGSGLLLGDILNQCQKAVHTFLEMGEGEGDFYGIHGREPSVVADPLAAIAITTQTLLVRRGANLTVDLGGMATLNPYNGLLLQYWLSKISMKLEGVVISREALDQMDYSIFAEDGFTAFAEVLRLLIQFPGTVKTAFRTLEASHILTLLFRITDWLSEAWKADTDNQGHEAEEDVVDHAGPSSGPTVETLDYVKPAPKDSGEILAGPSSVKDQIGTEGSVEDEHRGGKREEDVNNQPEKPVEVLDLEIPKEPGVQAESAEPPQGEGLGPGLSVDEISLPQKGASPSQTDRADEISESAIETTAGEIGGQDVRGQDELSQEAPSKDEGAQVLGMQTRERKDSGILLGEDEIRKELSETEPSKQTLAAKEVDTLQENASQGEKQGLDSELPPQSKEEGQVQENLEPASTPNIAEAEEGLNKDTNVSCEPEIAGNVVQEDAEEGLSQEQDFQREKGKGKERADQAGGDETAPDIPPETLVKLAFYQCVRQVLENGMRMVGLVPLGS